MDSYRKGVKGGDPEIREGTRNATPKERRNPRVLIRLPLKQSGLLGGPQPRSRRWRTKTNSRLHFSPGQTGSEITGSWLDCEVGPRVHHNSRVDLVTGDNEGPTDPYHLGHIDSLNASSRASTLSNVENPEEPRLVSKRKAESHAGHPNNDDDVAEEDRGPLRKRSRDSFASLRLHGSPDEIGCEVVESWPDCEVEPMVHRNSGVDLVTGDNEGPEDPCHLDHVDSPNASNGVSTPSNAESLEESEVVSKRKAESHRDYFNSNDDVSEEDTEPPRKRSRDNTYTYPGDLSQGVPRQVKPNFPIIKIMQVNCQRSSTAVCDLMQKALEAGVQICLLQETHMAFGRPVGLPSGLTVFATPNGKAAVVVLQEEISAIPVKLGSFENGVCIHTKGPFGELLLVSLYCPPGQDVHLSLNYLDDVVAHAAGHRILIGMDSNAISDLWHSKNSLGKKAGHSAAARGEILSDWILGSRLEILNEPSEAYTFVGPRGFSDIDVTLVGGDWGDQSRVEKFSWKILEGWGLSDHNPIEIGIAVTSDLDTVELLPSEKRWNSKDVDWSAYTCYVKLCANDYGIEPFNQLEVEDKVNMLCGWITDANDGYLKRTSRSKRPQTQMVEL